MPARLITISRVIFFVLLGCLPALAQQKDGAVELEFWKSVRDSQSPEQLNAYLKQYPDGTFAALARIRLKALGESSKAEPAPVREEKHPGSAADDTLKLYQGLNQLGKLLDAELVRQRKPLAYLTHAVLAHLLNRFPEQDVAATVERAKASSCQPGDETARYTCLALLGDVIEALRQAYPGKQGAIFSTALTTFEGSQTDPAKEADQDALNEPQRNEADVQKKEFDIKELEKLE